MTSGPFPGTRVLDGKTALVTGASGGIGKAIAVALAASGASIVVNYHSNRQAAEETLAAIAANGSEAIAVEADIADPASVDRLFQESAKRFSSPDILVNNAGMTRDGLLMRMSTEDWDRVIAVDLRGAFLCTRAALRGMLRRRWGRIVNISSVVGLVGNAGAGQLRGCQSWIDRPDNGDSARSRFARHYRERARAGLYRNEHDGRAHAGTEGGGPTTGSV